MHILIVWYSVYYTQYPSANHLYRDSHAGECPRMCRALKIRYSYKDGSRSGIVYLPIIDRMSVGNIQVAYNFN